MDEQREKITFKPLTEGLGFHPAVRPPAPPKISPRATGIGAVAAGPAIVVLPKKHSPQPPVQSAVEPAVPVTKIATPLLEASQPGIMYPIKRGLAFLLDTVLNTLVGILAIWAVSWKLSFTFGEFFAHDLMPLTIGFLAFFSWALVSAQEIAFRTSVAKKIFGLYLDGPSITVFFRSVFFYVSLGLAGLGILWSLFDRKKRCWHDILTGVRVSESALL